MNYLIEDVTVEVGPNHRVTIDKLFGPLIFFNLRISLDIQTCEWVIERQSIRRDKKGDDEEVYTEVHRVPGQVASDWPDDQPQHDLFCCLGSKHDGACEVGF